VNSIDDKVPHGRGNSSWVGIVLGLWLAGVYTAVIAGKLWTKSESEGALYLTLLIFAILWPLLYFLLSRSRFVPTRIHTGTLFALVIFFVFSLVSCFVSPVEFTSTAYVLLTLASVWIALQFITNIDARTFETGLKVYCAIMASVLMSFAAYDYTPGLRLGLGKEILNPNAIAMVTLSALLSAMAIRNLLIRCALILPLFFLIYLTGSRASMIGALLGFSVIIYERTRRARGGAKLKVILGLLFALSLGVFYWAELFPHIEDFLHLNTRDRGLSSGASGRIYAWKETWRLFSDNPIFGVGFRAHEHLLKIGSSSHNGYLAMLAEIGFVGFSAITYLVISGVAMLRKQAKHTDYTYTYSILIGLSGGYLFLALFERFLVNVGNPTSLLFLIAILTPMVPRERHVLSKQSRISITNMNSFDRSKLRSSP
jgi:O-antigen ligase